jgi:hypothetical protein
MIEIGKKKLSDADCRYVFSDNARSGDDNQILVPKEICDRLNWPWNSKANDVSFKVDKNNLITALRFAKVFNSKKLYYQGKEVFLDEEWFKYQIDVIENHFNESNESDYYCKTKLSTQDRHYLNGFRQISGLNIQEFLIPGFSVLVFKTEEGQVYIEVDYITDNLREFCFTVFKFLVDEFGDHFLRNKSKVVDTKIGEVDYKGVVFGSYFRSAKLLGVFEPGQADSIINSKKDRFRYQKESLKILYKDKEVYFSTEFEYKRSNESHILFFNYRRFVEDYSGNKYSISKDTDGYYHLMLKEDNSERILLVYVKNSLREFAFKAFQEVHREFGDEFLNLQKSYFNRKHNEKPIKSIGFKDYFGSKKIFGVFDSKQDKSTLKTGTSLRYNPTNLGIMGEENIYFSSQWSHPYDKSHPDFEQFVHFINDYGQGLYEVEFDPIGKIYSLLKKKKKITFMPPIQKIFFGPPGSGKSHLIKTKYPGNWPRIIFHPELDYQGFIGAYKPTMKYSPNKGDQITYQFIEEAFLRAYCMSWKSEEPFFLIIEEINRGNCAQIFGDIFQLLDRGEDGYSEYPIICSVEIQRYLKRELQGISRLHRYNQKTGAEDFSRMCLPNNLNILCTMNTSDQSLFPMDSAFKRRWDWQYVPIDYKDAANFRIDLEDGKKEINWGEFIKAINGRIKEHTQSEDKQIGNRFVSPRNNLISKEQFVSKVVFYLWSEIYKDEHGSGLSVFPVSNKGKDGLTFSDFFNLSGDVDTDIIRTFIEFNLPKGTENYGAIEEGEIEMNEEEE